MIRYLADRIASVFVLYGESSEDNADIYAYAVEALIAGLFNVIIGLTISLLFGRVLEGIVFIIVFAFLRRYVGGYHANSHYKCILIFCLLLTCSMLATSALSYVKPSVFVIIIIAMLAWSGIFFLVSIEDKSMRCRDERRAKLKTKSLLANTFFLILCLIVGFTISTCIASVISLAMFSVFGCIVARLINKHMRRRV